MSDRSYSETEAQEILRRASSIQTSGAMSRQELLRAAAEVGIPPQAIEEAEAQMLQEKRDAQWLAEFRKKRRESVISSLWGFAVYLGIAAWISGPQLRYIYVTGFFALCGLYGVLKEAWLAFNERSEAWQKEYEKFRSQKLRRQQVPEEASDELLRDILVRNSPEAKLNVIKEYRERTGLGLKDAKEDVERFYKQHPEEVQLHTS